MQNTDLQVYSNAAPTAMYSNPLSGSIRLQGFTVDYSNYYDTKYVVPMVNTICSPLWNFKFLL